MCGTAGGAEHLWNSSIGVPSRSVICDWCVTCGAARPGFIDPKERVWDGGAFQDSGTKALQRLQGRESESEEMASRPASGAAVPNASLEVSSRLERARTPYVSNENVRLSGAGRIRPALQVSRRTLFHLSACHWSNETPSC